MGPSEVVAVAWMVAFDVVGHNWMKPLLNCGDTQEPLGLACVLEHGNCRQNGGKEVGHLSTGGGMQGQPSSAIQPTSPSGRSLGAPPNTHGPTCAYARNRTVQLSPRHQMHMGRPSGARPLRQVARLSGQRPTQPGRRNQIPMGLTCGDTPTGAPGHTRAPPNTHGLRSERRRRADSW